VTDRVQMYFFRDELEKLAYGEKEHRGLAGVTARRKYVYYGLTSEEAKASRLNYEHSSKYTGKGVNTTLGGLKKFVKDHDLSYLTHYTRVPIGKFEIMHEVLPDEEYNMLTVKAPFSLRLDSYSPRALGVRSEQDEDEG